jgi:hypothetical protein
VGHTFSFKGMLAVFEFLSWLARIPGWIARAQAIHNTIRQIRQNRLERRARKRIDFRTYRDLCIAFSTLSHYPLGLRRLA